jgi:ABC-type phosphate transport system ATPase subunit
MRKNHFVRCFNGLVPHFYQGELKGEITVAGLNVLEHHTYEMAKHVGWFSKIRRTSFLRFQ